MTRALEPHALPARPPAVRLGAGQSPAALAGAAAVLVGLATAVNYGQYDPRALLWLTAAAAATLLAVRRAAAAASARAADPLAAADPPDAGLWVGLVAVQFVLAACRHPTVPELAGTAGLPLVRAGLAVVAAAAVAGVLAAARSGTSSHSAAAMRLKVLCVAAMLAGYLVAGATVLAAHPVPGVDVITFQRDACDAVLAGRSPYGVTFPDESPAGSAFYAAGVVRGGRLHFGFPYPPLSLLWVLPAHVLAGDFRYTGLIATAAAGGLVALASPRPRAVAAAGLLLLAPTGLFVVWAGWTEPLVLLCLAGTVACAGRVGVWHEFGETRFAGTPPRRGLCPRVLRITRTCPTPGRIRGHSPRRGGVPDVHPGHAPLVCYAITTGAPVLLPVVLGLLLASKQYAVLLLPLVPLLVPAGRRARTAAVAVLVAAAVTLPTALSDPAGFLHSAVLLQVRQPFRADALSFLAPLHGALPAAAAAAVPFLVTLAVTAWALRSCPRTPAGFALASAAVLLAFFALNKQAFCNYYHLVIGTLCCAAAAGGTEPQMDTDEHGWGGVMR